LIEILPYDDAWPGQFETVAALIAPSLSVLPGVAVEHVGSTSVPGLAAKPVIDVDVVVDRGLESDAIVAMSSAGFECIGDLGIPDRYAFQAPDDLGFRTNVYVVVAGSLALRNHLAVRDLLRSDDAMRDRYAAVKLEMADKHQDLAGYTEAKSDILGDILRNSGLTEEELGEIEEVNRADG
jgi:GrpB-like predicted nucleotidyltransferase (UPF0157 family)